MSPGRKDRMSRMNRRAFITLLGGTAIARPRAVLAQSYPSRPITMIVPFPAGGGADVLVRILTKHMADDLGQVIVVQNQPGAGGAIAFGQLARAAPDGYTLAWTSAGFAVMAVTLSNLSFDPQKDFVHICNVAENPFVLVVNPQVTAKSVQDLIEFAKAHPGTMNFAHNGTATLTNLVVEMLKLQTGISVAQVAYRGDVLVQPGLAAACGSRAAARPGGDLAQALAGRAGAAHDDRGRGARLPGGGVARLQRSGRHAATDCRSPQRRGTPSAAGGGRDGAVQGAGRAACRQHAGRFRRADPTRAHGMGRRRASLRRQTQLAQIAHTSSVRL